MKTGVIVYVGHSSPELDSIDLESAVKTLGIDADRVELVAPNAGHFDIQDAWWSLTCRGMQTIICKFAELVAPNGIRFTGRELRICG